MWLYKDRPRRWSKRWERTGKKMVEDVSKDRTRDGRKSEQGQDKEMIEDVGKDRTRRWSRR
jgi:hypothetical protein